MNGRNSENEFLNGKMQSMIYDFTYFIPISNSKCDLAKSFCIYYIMYLFAQEFGWLFWNDLWPVMQYLRTYSLIKKKKNRVWSKTPLFRLLKRSCKIGNKLARCSLKCCVPNEEMYLHFLSFMSDLCTFVHF